MTLVLIQGCRFGGDSLEPREFERRGMANFGSAAAAGEGSPRPAAVGSSSDGEWNAVAAAHRRAVAGRARTLRQLEQHLALLPALVQERHLGGCGGDTRRDHGRQSTS